MALTVIASANANPSANPTDDIVIDLASVAIGSIPDQQLYGYAADSNDPSPAWVYSWAILYKPTGSSAALDNPALQNPKIQTLSGTWGNYRLLLVVTNTNTGETSEADPLKAPTASFVTVRIKSAVTSIQKMAAGERNWFDDIHAWADAIESGGGAGVGAHAVIDHTDVTNATGADLEALTQGGYANDPAAPSNPLHKHTGAHVDVAATATSGVVFLEEAPVAGATPKVITKEKLYFTGTTNTTIFGDTVFVGIKRSAPPTSLSSFSGTRVPHIIFDVGRETSAGGLVLDGWTVTLLDQGTYTVGDPKWEVELWEGDETKFEQCTMSLLPGSTSISANQTAYNNAPITIASSAGLGWAVTKKYLGVVVTATPGASSIVGNVLGVTLRMLRPI